MNAIPIYIINLKRTPERKLFMQRQLDSLGLEYRWIEAVDAYDLKQSQLKGVDTQDKYQPKAMACLMSHIKAYDQILKNNHQIACILEDDAHLSPSFAHLLEHKELQNMDWQVLLLAHHSRMTWFLLNYYYRLASRKQVGWGAPSLPLAASLGSPSTNPVKLHVKDHYMAKPCVGSRLTTPKLAQAYLIRLSAARKFREIALANIKSIYADDITGHADILGVSCSLITPPCVVMTPVYLQYSLILRISAQKNHEQNIPELLRLFMRSKWKALSLSFCTLKIKLGLCFSLYLIRMGWQKIKECLGLDRRYDERIVQIKR